MPDALDNDETTIHRIRVQPSYLQSMVIFVLLLVQFLHEDRHINRRIQVVTWYAFP